MMSLYSFEVRKFSRTPTCGCFAEGISAVSCHERVGSPEPPDTMEGDMGLRSPGAACDSGRGRRTAGRLANDVGDG